MARKSQFKYRWKLLDDGSFGILAPNNRTIESGLTLNEAMSKVQSLNKARGKSNLSSLTAKIADIKDREPNQHTIKQLETLLEYAKNGELRTFISVCGWDDDS